MTVSQVVRERPIIFSGEMVRAILEGRKTQTRRVIQPQPSDVDGATCFLMGDDLRSDGRDKIIRCPYGQPGDRLWVRETARLEFDQRRDEHRVRYQADDYDTLTSSEGALEWIEAAKWKNVAPRQWRTPWRPSIHMPRWASRLTLEITEVRVQRVQEIGDDDCYAEGVVYVGEGFDPPPQVIYRELWDSLNAKRGYSWESNPWVWAISFRVYVLGMEVEP